MLDFNRLMSTSFIQLSNDARPPKNVLKQCNGVENKYKGRWILFLFSDAWKRTFTQTEQRQLLNILYSEGLLRTGRSPRTSTTDIEIGGERYPGYRFDRKRMRDEIGRMNIPAVRPEEITSQEISSKKRARRSRTSRRELETVDW
jgi:hypothetical protein